MTTGLKGVAHSNEGRTAVKRYTYTVLKDVTVVGAYDGDTALAKVDNERGITPNNA